MPIVFLTLVHATKPRTSNMHADIILLILICSLTWFFGPIGVLKVLVLSVLPDLKTLVWTEVTSKEIITSPSQRSFHEHFPRTALLKEWSCSVIWTFSRFHLVLARLHFGAPVRETGQRLGHWPLFRNVLLCLSEVVLVIVLVFHWFMSEAFGLDQRWFLDMSTLPIVTAFFLYIL